MKTIISTVLPLFVAISIGSLVHVQAQEPLDGPSRIFNDELLNNLVGNWKLKCAIRGGTAENTVRFTTLLPGLLKRRVGAS